MSRRRFVEPGRITANDRRTTRRHFLFTPDISGKMAQIFWYCLAIAARDNNVLVHAAVLLSTHPHYVVTDQDGRLPKFKEQFHRLLALCTKELRSWPEEVFNKSQPGEHELVSPSALVDAIAYLIANPALGFAVRYSKDWPGAKTLVSDIGRRVIRVLRPDEFFDPTNPDWPKWMELRLVMPEILIAHYGSLEAAQEAITKRVKEYELEARQEAERRGRSFSGARRVVRTAHTVRSNSREEYGALNPQFAAAGDSDAARAAVQRLRTFNADYEQALARWVAGDRDVVFPHGTWWMRVHHGVRCHPPP